MKITNATAAQIAAALDLPGHEDAKAYYRGKLLYLDEQEDETAVHDTNTISDNPGCLLIEWYDDSPEEVSAPVLIGDGAGHVDWPLTLVSGDNVVEIVRPGKALSPKMGPVLNDRLPLATLMPKWHARALKALADWKQ